MIYFWVRREINLPRKNPDPLIGPRGARNLRITLSCLENY